MYPLAKTGQKNAAPWVEQVSLGQIKGWRSEGQIGVISYTLSRGPVCEAQNESLNIIVMIAKGRFL